VFDKKEVQPEGEAGHYVIVLKADETGVEIIDPTYVGSFMYSASLWEAQWTGHILAPATHSTWMGPIALTAIACVWGGLGLYSWRVWRSRRSDLASTLLTRTDFEKDATMRNAPLGRTP
jgi:hypothetical protein